MKERSFDEMIAYFNRRVSEMDIAQDYKMELLGMVTALGYKHEKSVPQWIPCSERLPEVDESVLVTTEWDDISIAWRTGIDKWLIHEGNTSVTTDDLTAWMPLPQPWRGEEHVPNE